MNQIDWPWLAMMLFWTGGVGSGLSILGWAYDRAVREGKPIRAILTQAGYRLALVISSGLLFTGLLLLTAPIGFKIAWGAAIIWFVVELGLHKQE